METDDLELDTLGDRKTALFVIISDTDDTFNFISEANALIESIDRATVAEDGYYKTKFRIDFPV